MQTIIRDQYRHLQLIEPHCYKVIEEVSKEKSDWVLIKGNLPSQDGTTAETFSLVK